ncbi:hypothetical protein M8J75_005353 [Diaphorina citri]|nr:hypothetical protein M8J75_005353 [Diaphorina citri]
MFGNRKQNFQLLGLLVIWSNFSVFVTFWAGRVELETVKLEVIEFQLVLKPLPLIPFKHVIEFFPVLK